MPCLLGCLALFFPRVVIVLVWLFSDYLQRAFGDTILWPLLGFIFLPVTTLAYAFVINTYGQVQGVGIFVLILAVLFDLGLLGGGGASGRRYRSQPR